MHPRNFKASLGGARLGSRRGPGNGPFRFRFRGCIAPSAVQTNPQGITEVKFSGGLRVRPNDPQSPIGPLRSAPAPGLMRAGSPWWGRKGKGSGEVGVSVVGRSEDTGKSKLTGKNVKKEWEENLKPVYSRCPFSLPPFFSLFLLQQIFACEKKSDV